jgi:hypothetical protein
MDICFYLMILQVVVEVLSITLSSNVGVPVFNPGATPFENNIWPEIMEGPP